MNFAVWIVLLIGSLGWLVRILIPIHDTWVYKNSRARRTQGQPEALRKSVPPIFVFLLAGLVGADLILFLINLGSLCIVAIGYIWTQLPSPNEVAAMENRLAKLAHRSKKRKVKEHIRKKEAYGSKPSF